MGWKPSKSEQLFELACSTETGNIHQDLPYNEKSIDDFGRMLFDALNPNQKEKKNEIK